MHADLPPDAIWQALTTSHQHLAQAQGQARRYAATVAPFAAVADRSASAFADLASLLQKDDAVYILDQPPPATPVPRLNETVPSLQMYFPVHAPLPPISTDLRIVPLTCEHAPEMLVLIDRVYPGFFRAETCLMGRYVGIRDGAGTLVAMGGERLQLDPWTEISGLCSDPSHAGRGLGTAILAHLLALHRAEGTQSFLHVTASNRKAVQLYLRLGFRTVRSVELYRVQRTS